MQSIFYDGSDNEKLREANGLLRDIWSMLKTGDHAFEVKYDKGKSVTINFLGRRGEPKEEPKKADASDKPSDKSVDQTIADQLDSPTEFARPSRPKRAGSSES